MHFENNPEHFSKQKILVILGPTAVGKTDLALALAKKYNGELVAADSRQVYKGLDIGTGKLASRNQDTKTKIQKGKGFWVMEGIKVWMYDVADPTVQYSVKEYVDGARKAIAKIAKRGKLPILVGGSGLYIKGLLYGFEDMSAPINEQLRKELESLSLEELQKRVESSSPTLLESLNNSERNNKRRLIRKIEISIMNPYINTKKQTAVADSPDYAPLLLGLLAPRSLLNSMIDSRLTFRFSHGLVAEVKSLLRGGLSLERMRALGLEYGELADLIEGKINEEQCLIRLKNVNHQYAKRQMTYFKKMPNVNWFDVSDENYLNKLGKIAADWYNT